MKQLHMYFKIKYNIRSPELEFFMPVFMAFHNLNKPITVYPTSSSDSNYCILFKKDNYELYITNKDNVLNLQSSSPMYLVSEYNSTDLINGKIHHMNIQDLLCKITN